MTNILHSCVHLIINNIPNGGCARDFFFFFLKRARVYQKIQKFFFFFFFLLLNIKYHVSLFYFFIFTDKNVIRIIFHSRSSSYLYLLYILLTGHYILYLPVWYTLKSKNGIFHWKIYILAVYFFLDKKITL